MHSCMNSLSSLLVGLPRWLSVKNLPANSGDPRDMASIPGQERSPGRGNGNPLQYSEESRGQRSLVGYSPWVVKSWIWQSTHAACIISWFCIYELAYNLFTTSKLILMLPSQSPEHTGRAGKTLSHQTHLFPTEVKQGIVLLGSQTENQRPLDGLFGVTFSHFCAFCWQKQNTQMQNWVMHWSGHKNVWTWQKSNSVLVVYRIQLPWVRRTYCTSICNLHPNSNLHSNTDFVSFIFILAGPVLSTE